MKYLIFDAGPIISLTMNGMREKLCFSRALRLLGASLVGGRSLSLVGGRLK